ncbi:MAG: methenyltetrahydromethanopterin cyclohydrolase [Chloroflexi bacterium]|nr:methenyltetrahydromethanopterin cyclohydrolase [Chloroflexota bacterium]
MSLNERAAEIARQMIADAEALGLAVTRLPNGATVVDAGVEVPGSLEAGRLFAEVCMGGLGQVSFCDLDFDGLRLPGVSVTVSHPPLACLAAQLAGWPVRGRDEENPYKAMGSGPARALYGVEEIFERLDYRDRADAAVLCLEGGQLPPEEVTEDVAAKCGLSPDCLYVLIAPPASLVCAVQVAARVVEAGLHKMMEVGFDVRAVLSGFGTCPLASVAADDLRAIGRMNDAVLYGGRAWYTVRADDAQIERVIEQLPSSASRDYGTPFYDLFLRYDCDFYKIDPLLFSVAEISINNLTSGRVFRAGGVNCEMVRRSLLG